MRSLEKWGRLRRKGATGTSYLRKRVVAIDLPQLKLIREERMAHTVLEGGRRSVP